ncbi:MAG TPA: FAD-dependent oxidoreductase [Cyanobacteria bacterium UBA11149]|nr:FAD-dependent oxidoreductase [Cyanobacteria bacterium UBA11367]HBE59323.1 FAD-dependent oxidoreductase [Cyanobacteria bacterium UBA11366]HBK63545.1 FAD-dependent oxidoreductase [Cyanobacteria bacterium UBA11166]HBR72391.1 FAD-dependent oxidoreductase [Cyanobacteria bacterium UBA11159]HBS72397.1 FAD-dependent oxidoreductase [Cyanobacteria bacterium UBA11153]HBW92252.1 FAD-dependent oxidoreductase [Cyanobacteria bacterium UBA11149]HCA95136.1 FAD-dependent oxidoreductase [Cyanobacteria bacter
MKPSNISVGKSLLSLTLSLIPLTSLTPPSLSAPPRNPDQTVDCDILVVGGGLAGAGTAYEGLLAGKTVCLTEITDWVGGQISSQGTSALDERSTQRQRLFFPRGYLELRERIKRKYKELNPGDCWVSESCFLPGDGNKILYSMLRDAAKRGKGNLKWFPSTVIKEIERNANGNMITGAIAIQHKPAKNAPPLNTFTLSQTIEDAYQYENSSRFDKTIIRFTPQNKPQENIPNWYVVEATETGEIIGLTDIPYRLGIDPRSHLEPSASSTTNDPYCPQGFTYTFAMEATKEPQTHQMPPFYPEYAPYYSYELPRLADFGLVFTYRRIWSPKDGEPTKFGGINFTGPAVGDISMQNWTWGNDYRPGTSRDNLIYSRDQLQATGQLSPGGWMGGLRTEALQKGEEKSIGYFYWLVAGTTDSQLGDGVKKTHPNYQYLSGFDSPMGTAHGLSKYPYMREGRRIIGRTYFGYEDGFTIWEIDMSRRDYSEDFYKKTLSPDMYRSLFIALAGRETISAIENKLPPEQIKRRTRSTIYPDSVGIGHYAIDFHPCMTKSPPETPGNTEREGERQGAGQAYPFQIPLRAMIPQKIDNMLVAGKSIATSHIAAAAYRVHSFEWSSGVAAGATAAFALEKGIVPYQLVDELPSSEPQLLELRQRLEKSGNPTAFPNTSIFNESWDAWR